eukprot:6472602-Amphidinium_carterae.1
MEEKGAIGKHWKILTSGSGVRNWTCWLPSGRGGHQLRDYLLHDLRRQGSKKFPIFHAIT